MTSNSVIDDECISDLQMSEFVRAIVENTLDLVMVIDRTGHILFINRTVLGLKLQQVIGSTVFEYVPEKFHERS